MNNSIEFRLSRLEKNLRFYRLGTPILAGIIFLMLLMAFKDKKALPDVLEAKAFHVVDDNGRVLMELNKEDGNGQLSTFSADGKRLVSLFTTDGGAGGINTYGNKGEVLFKVTNTKGGGGYLALFNANTKEIAELGVTDLQSGYLKLNDRDANKIAWLTYTENGGGYMSLAKAGKELIRLSTPAIGGRLGIYNDTNTRIIYLGTQDNKDGNITVWNASGARIGSLPPSTDK